MSLVHGLHHVTCLCSDAASNVRFYRDLLGLRLVKRTVQAEDPFNWQLFYGDEHASPGTLISFVANPDWPPGRVGPPMANGLWLSVPPGSIDFWRQRARLADVPLGVPAASEGGMHDELLVLGDPDGLPVTLCVSEHDPRPGNRHDMIPPEYAIRGLLCLDLVTRYLGPTRKFIEAHFGWQSQRFSDGTISFDADLDRPARGLVLVRSNDTPGQPGAGTVHHIALRLSDPRALAGLHERLVAAKVKVSPMIDRTYFTGLYVREPGGILLSVATDGPGFTIDEPLDTLGQRLCLPSHLEAMRKEIEAELPGI